MSLSLTISIGWRASWARSISDPTFKFGADVVHSTSRMGRAGNSRISRSTSTRAGSSARRMPNRISNSGYCCERMRANGFVEACVLAIDRFQNGDGKDLAVGDWGLGALAQSARPCAKS